MEIHPVAALLPSLSPLEAKGLAADIKANGLREPIKIWRGLLVDGRHRLKACAAAGAEPRFEELRLADEQAVIAYIISANIHRRHMSAGQVALLGEALRPHLVVLAKERQLAGKKHLGPTSGQGPDDGKVNRELAKLLNIGHGTVAQAHAIATKAPELAAKVQANEMALNAAYRQIMEPKPRATQIDDDKKDAIASAVLDEGKTRKQVAAEYDVGENTVQRAMEVKKAVEKALKEAPIDPRSLPMTAQQRIQAVIRQEKRRLELEFEQRVMAEIKERLDEITLPHWQKRIERAEAIIARRDGVLTAEEYRFLLTSVHPDRVTDPELKDRFNKAFVIFQKIKDFLVCDEKELPIKPPARPFPTSFAEMVAQREAARKQRKA